MNIESNASDYKSRIKTPFKSVSPKRPSAAEPSQRPVSVSPENRNSVTEESKGQMQVVTEAAQDDGSDYESPSPGKVSSVPSLLSSPGRVPGNSPPTLSIYCLLPSSSILKTFISISENFFLRSFLNYLNAELQFSTSFLRSPIRYWPLVSRLCTH